MVRQPGRGGREPLRLHLRRGLEGAGCHVLHRGVAGRAGRGHDRRIPAGRQEYVALNGGPQFPFTEAISLSVDCESQAEVDELWAKLTDGGEESQCGWLKDKYGLSWQIVPRGLSEALSDPDPAKADRAMKAMLGMKKLDIEALLNA